VRRNTIDRTAALLVLLAGSLTAMFGARQQAAPGIAGTWHGTLRAGGAALRLELHVTRAAGGALAATLDSLDQGVTGLRCTAVTLAGQRFSFQVPAVHGSFQGKVGAGAGAISGTWSQGAPLPLTFARGPAPAGPAHPLALLPARPPVPLAMLRQTLGRELAPIVAHGVLAPNTGDGLVIGVLQNGVKEIFAYGAAKPDSLFEIGSITKSFTALALAQLIVQHRLRLNEPVRALLPFPLPPSRGAEITLADLATQHSGLPRLPPNLDIKADPANPYAGYGAAQLAAYLAQRGLTRPPQAAFLYSNLGYGLLGFALAASRRETYPALIRREVTGPLGLRDTAAALTAAQRRRLLPGHNLAGTAVAPWTFQALAGAGALRSTAGDLLTFLGAQLDPPAGGTLPRAIALTHVLRADGPPPLRVGMGWLYTPAAAMYWHDGATGGYTAFAEFIPRERLALVVLYNREDLGGGDPPFADRVAANVTALLRGSAAPRLTP
jgi:D-alanyl-D-alanine-carboxypeptidase/D-alanyl-D-alanine-endopeptidase